MKALVISERDNVATALEPLDAGASIAVRGGTITIAEPVARGHKIALRAIQAGEAIVKYGSPIGVASADIAAGMHVHTHNLVSTRGRGDLTLADRRAQSHSAARLAEPPDEPPYESIDEETPA